MSSLSSVPTLSDQPLKSATTRTQTTKKRRTGLRFVVILIVVGALGGTGWAATKWLRTATVSASVGTFEVKPLDFNVVLKEKGELKASKSKEIKSEVEGRSTIISLVPEGTAVKEGDLLVELASDQIDDRIRQEELKEANAITAFESAKTELEIQRDRNASDIRKAILQIELRGLELDKYNKGDWEQQLRDHQIAIDQAKITLERKLEEYNAAKQLRERNFMTVTEFKEDEFEWQRAEWDLEKAKKALEVLQAYTYVSELKQRESDYDEAKKEAERVKKNADAEEIKKLRALEGAEKELSIIQDQLAKLRRQKEKCRITAPTQGFVVYYGGGGGGGFRMMSNDGQIKEGAEVFERQVLLELPDTTEMTVICRIHEAKTDKLKVGQSAAAEIEGVPGKRFSGKVTKIAILADTQNRWLNPDLKEYETEITLDSSDVPLKPGVTAHVEIFVESVQDRLAVPVQSVYSKGGKRFVFAESKSRIAPVEVTLGSVGTEWVEVIKGVAEGDRIVLAANEEQRRMLPDAPGGEGGSRGQRGPGGMRPRPNGTTGAPGATGAAVPGKPDSASPSEKKETNRKGKPADSTAPAGAATSGATPVPVPTPGTSGAKGQ